MAGGGLTNFDARTGCGSAGTCSRTIPLPIRRRVSASSRSERSTSSPSASGLANDCVISPLSWTRRRNASWRCAELAVDQPRQRNAHIGGVGVQQEHQPVQARLGGGVELQLRI